MTRYRRLPGVRRGFIHGSSVWLGDDHLLLVKSMRFREEYKKFYLRDIQAVAVARAPRFHISTRAAAVAVVLLLAIWIASLLGIPAMHVSVATTPNGNAVATSTITSSNLPPALWAVGAVVLAAWLYISAAASCRCRIYTAVSADELPSVYRSWTARKFLAAIEPRIAEVQGVLEGPWAEAAENREIGPPVAIGGLESGPSASRRAPSHTLTSDVFLAALFASGLVAVLTLKAPLSVARVPAIAFMLIKVGLALGVFVQHYKGKLQTAMQRVAIAALVVMGAIYYAQQMVEGIRVGAESAANKQYVAPIVPAIVSGNRFVTEVDAGASIVLGCVGLGIVLMSKDRGGA